MAVCIKGYLNRAISQSFLNYLGLHSLLRENVSPFDYLEPGDKTALVDAYQRQVIEPYVASGVQAWGAGGGLVRSNAGYPA